MPVSVPLALAREATVVLEQPGAEFLAEEKAMANRTKRATTRKTKSKGGKARSKSLHKNARKRAAPKKAKKVATKRLATKARRGGVTTRTRARKQKQSLGPAAGT